MFAESKYVLKKCLHEWKLKDFSSLISGIFDFRTCRKSFDGLASAKSSQKTPFVMFEDINSYTSGHSGIILLFWVFVGLNCPLRNWSVTSI